MTDTVDQFDAELGSRIAEARRCASLTQTELAGRLSLTRSSIANIEAGRQRMLATTLIEVGDALGVDPRWLLTGDTYAPRRHVRRMPRADADQIRRATTVLRSLADGLDSLHGLPASTRMPPPITTEETT